MANKKKRDTDLYEDCDGMFAYIAGYTSGGFPYGHTWEEVGIDSELPFEEKVKLYEQGKMARKSTEECFLDQVEVQDEELPFY